jgi:hypothetical protein
MGRRRGSARHFVGAGGLLSGNNRAAADIAALEFTGQPPAHQRQVEWTWTMGSHLPINGAPVFGAACTASDSPVCSGLVCRWKVRKLSDGTPPQNSNWAHRRAEVDSAPDEPFTYNTRLEPVFTDSLGYVVVVSSAGVGD